MLPYVTLLDDSLPLLVLLLLSSTRMKSQGHNLKIYFTLVGSVTILLHNYAYDAMYEMDRFILIA